MFKKHNVACIKISKKMISKFTKIFSINLVCSDQCFKS